MFLSIDFETVSCADLRKTGAAAYAEHPTTDIICLSYAFGDGPIQTWVPAEDPAFPPDVADWVSRGEPVRGWNVWFEYWVWNASLRRRGGPFDTLPALDFQQLHCSMAQAAYNGLPLALDAASRALPKLGIVKDAEGQQLMLRMCRPRDFHPDGTPRWWHLEDPAKRARLVQYCENDVRVERLISDTLMPLPAREREVWLMDFEAQARGILLDAALVSKIEEAADGEAKRLDWEMRKLTAGAVKTTRQVTALTNWLVSRGLKVEDGMAKGNLPELIARAPEGSRERRALEIRQEAAKSSIAKLRAMKHFACADGRLRGLTQYYGAFRTGRWAGRGPQLQNFPRSLVKDQALLVELLLSTPVKALPAQLEFLLGVSVLDACASALRGCLTVPEDAAFGALDFAQIEARVLAWLSGCEHVLDAFRALQDLYIVAAASIFGVAAKDVTPEQRQIGKVAVLALGFQGGPGAFLTMAANYGVSIPEAQALEIVQAYRRAHPEIVNYWYSLERAAKRAIENPGVLCDVGSRIPGGPVVTFRMWRGHLCLRLPSGRPLIYRDAFIADGYSDFGPQITYMGMNQLTRAWERTPTYGGKLAENITQATARDLMAEAKLRLRARGFRVLGSVHDEALFEMDNPEDFQTARGLVERSERWADGLPVVADGYVGRRFRKG